jgi:hypothetical protein
VRFNEDTAREPVPETGVAAVPGREPLPLRRVRLPVLPTLSLSLPDSALCRSRWCCSRSSEYCSSFADMEDDRQRGGISGDGWLSVCSSTGDISASAVTSGGVVDPSAAAPTPPSECREPLMLARDAATRNAAHEKRST